jgi:hypothetical protein
VRQLFQADVVLGCSPELEDDVSAALGGSSAHLLSQHSLSDVEARLSAAAAAAALVASAASDESIRAVRARLRHYEELRRQFMVSELAGVDAMMALSASALIADVESEYASLLIALIASDPRGAGFLGGKSVVELLDRNFYFDLG